jgi:hypothetical protein
VSVPTRPRRVPLSLAVLFLAATPARAADEPRIRTIQPAVVERGVGTDVVVEGTNLWPVEDVTVNRADVSVSVASSGNSPTRLRLHVTTSEASKPGPMRLTVKTKSGTATSDRLSVRLRSPTVSKVTPNELSRGRTYDVVVAGANLALKGSETKTSVPAPMTVARGEASTDRQLLAKVGVPPEAPLGPSAITIETEDGKVSAPFTVVASPPSVESVEPGRVVRGVPATLRVAGENLTGATAMLAVPDAGVVVAPDGPSGPDGFSVRVQAAANAVPGSRTLVVLTADGTASVRFDVVVEPPVLERVAPAGAPRGTTTEVRVTGRGVPADAPIRVVPADPALRLESGSAGKPPRLSSDPAAVPGTRTLLVTTPQGALLAPFQVTLHPPHVSGIAPTEGAPGTTAEVTVEGTSLGDASWSVVPADGSVTVEPAGPGKLRVVVAPGARAGPRTLVARNRDGFAATLFSVTGSAPAAPVVSSVEPARVARRGPARVVVRGQNLAGESVVVEGEGGARIEAKVAEATSTALALDLATGPQTPLGAYLVRVETPGGGGAVVLEVAGDPPSVASVSPERTTRPFAGEVVLRGRALVEPDGSAPKVEVARADGGGALAAKVVSAAPEEVRLRLEVGADAPTGELIVSVATADGGAAALLAVDPRPPAVSSLAPRRIGVPATVDFAIGGENLVEPDGKPPRISVTRAGAASALRAQVVRSKADEVVVRVATPPAAVPGPHVLALRTADGVAAAVFEVVGVAPPVVESLERDAAEAGTALLTRIRGRGLQGATEVAFDGEGITATVLPGGSDAEVPVRIVVASGAKKGPRAFRVSAAGGDAGSGKVVLTVR